MTVANPAGYPDVGFNFAQTELQVGKADDTGASAVQPDRKIVVAGSVTERDGSHTIALIRYLPDGQLDTGFGEPAWPGVAELDSGQMIDAVHALAVNEFQGSAGEGDIVVAGSWTNAMQQPELALARFKPDGSLDTSFGSLGIANDPTHGNATAVALAIRTDGSIVVLGASNTSGSGAVPFVESFTPAGTLDQSFGVAGQSGVTPFGGEPAALNGGLALDAFGDILVARIERQSTSSATIAIARLAPDGQPDPSFGTEGIATETFEGSHVPTNVAGLAIYKLADIVVGGTADVYGYSAAQRTLTSSGFWAARFGAKGQFDSSFNGGFPQFVDFQQNAQVEFSENAGVALAPDGKIVLAGQTLGETLDDSSGYREEDIALARLNTDGSLDQSFGEGGLDVDPLGFGRGIVNALVHSVNVQSDGNIVAGYTVQEDSGLAGTISLFGLARFLGNPETIPPNSGTVPAGVYHETFVSPANPTSPNLQSSDLFQHNLWHNLQISLDRTDIAQGLGWDIQRLSPRGPFALHELASPETPAATDAITFPNFRPDVRVALASVDVTAYEPARVTFVGSNGSYTIEVAAHTTTTASAGESHVLTGTLLDPSLELGPIRAVILDSQDALFYNLKVLVIPGQGPLDDFVIAPAGTSTALDLLDYATGAAPTVGLVAPLSLVAPPGQPTIPGGLTVVSLTNPSDIIYNNTITPQHGQHPIDSFTYTVQDASGKTATGTVYVTIDTPPSVTVHMNQPATDGSDGWAFPHGTPGPLTGLVNISDAEGDPVQAGVYAQAAHGTVSLTKLSNYQYALSYLPPTTYAYDRLTGVSSEVSDIVGNDQFTLRVSDLGTGGQPLSNVDVVVQFVCHDDPPNTAAFAPYGGPIEPPSVSQFVVPENVGVSYYPRDEVQAGTYNSTIDFPGLVHFAAPGVLWNQADYAGFAGPSVDSLVLDPLRADLIAPTRHGLLYLYPDGSFNYTPHEGFVGVDQFQFYASDGYLSSVPTTVVIHVVPGTRRRPVENAPVLRDVHYSLDPRTQPGLQFTPPILAKSLISPLFNTFNDPSAKMLIRPLAFDDQDFEPRITTFYSPNIARASVLDLHLFDGRHSPDYAYTHDLSLFFGHIPTDASDLGITIGRTDSSNILPDRFLTMTDGEFAHGTATVSMTVAMANSYGWLSNFAAVEVSIVPRPLTMALAPAAHRDRRGRAEIAGVQAMALAPFRRELEELAFLRGRFRGILHRSKGGHITGGERDAVRFLFPR
jgi:uncharacterized delta-60 repeat protein